MHAGKIQKLSSEGLLYVNKVVSTGQLLPELATRASLYWRFDMATISFQNCKEGFCAGNEGSSQFMLLTIETFCCLLLGKTCVCWGWGCWFCIFHSALHQEASAGPSMDGEMMCRDLCPPV